MTHLRDVELSYSAAMRVYYVVRSLCGTDVPGDETTAELEDVDCRACRLLHATAPEVDRAEADVYTADTHSEGEGQ